MLITSGISMRALPPSPLRAMSMPTTNRPMPASNRGSLNEISLPRMSTSMTTGSRHAKPMKTRIQESFSRMAAFSPCLSIML